MRDIYCKILPPPPPNPGENEKLAIWRKKLDKFKNTSLGEKMKKKGEKEKKNEK